MLRLLEFTFQNSSVAEPRRTRGRIIPLSFLHFTISGITENFFVRLRGKKN